MVFLITGKAGAGKTTYGKRLSKDLEGCGYETEVVDADIIREITDNEDFSDSGRIKNLKTIAEIGRNKENEEKIVIISVIAPYKEWRDMMRTYWNKSFLVFIPGGYLWEGTEYETPTFDEIGWS